MPLLPKTIQQIQTMKMTYKGKRTLVITICLAIGLTARLIYCIKYPVMPRDSYIYYDIIMAWNETGQLSHGENGTIPPLALFLFSIPSIHFGLDVMKGAVLINILSGMAFLHFCIMIMDDVRNNLIWDFMVGILAATHPTLLQFSCQMTREMTYLLFVILAVFFFIHQRDRPVLPYMAMAGFFSSAAFLCRHEALELFPVIMSASLFFPLRTSCIARTKMIGTYLLSGGAAFFLILEKIDIPLSYFSVYYGEFLTKTIFR